MAEHPPLRAVKEVFPIHPHYLLLRFDTGEYRLGDLGDLAVRSEPLFAPLSDWTFFKQVRVDDDGETVVWPNKLDLDPSMLYQDSVAIDVRRLIASAR